jgi:hypothetical protein
LELLEAAISIAAEGTGIPARQIRKDFWITEMLRACVAGSGDSLIFKGGTSLSKAYGLIQRFSEDVDLLLVARGGMTAQHSAMKRLEMKVVEHTGLTGTLNEKTAVRGSFREVTFAFANQAPQDRGVKLEIGARGGALPKATRTITSIAGTYAAESLARPFEESATVEIEVLAPSRTLVEKLVILHEAHGRPPGAARDRRVSATVRHYYDIWCLLRDEGVRSDLKLHGTAVLTREICNQSRAIGLASVTYPKDGFSSSGAFRFASSLSQRKAYDATVPELLWPGALLPTFDECLAMVEEYKALL